MRIQKILENRAWKIVFTGIIAGAFWLQTAAGQAVVTGGEGRRIIVFPDSTWRYFDDTTLFSFRAPVASPENLPPPDIMAAEYQVKQLALDLIRVRIEKLETGTLLESLPENQNNAVLETQVETTTKWQTLDRKEKELETAYRLANEQVARLRKQPRIQAVPLPAGVNLASVIFPADREPLAAAMGKKDENTIEKSPATIAPVTRKYEAYSPSMDVMLYPPPIPCKFVPANQSGKTAEKMLEPGLFFSKTDEALRSYFPKGDLITCFANLVSAGGGLHYLQLNIIIASEKCPQVFGQVEKGALITFQTLEGQPIYFINNRSDAGVWRPDLSAYLYQFQTQVGGKEEKLLRTKELESVTVRWNKVQETFQVYDLDFFIRRFQCL
jgi:hypothetical protein